MKRILLAVIFSLAATLALAGSQDVSEAMHIIDINSPLPPVNPSLVKVYTYKPTGNVKFVGTIHARGMASVDSPGELDIVGRLLEAASPTVATEEDDKRLAMQALIKDAGAIGANGVIITKSVQVRVSPTATERRIEAFAIRVLADAPVPGSTREGECEMSFQCSSGQACRARACIQLPYKPRSLPALESVSPGGSCVGDEHCQGGFICHPNSGTCTPQ